MVQKGYGILYLRFTMNDGIAMSIPDLVYDEIIYSSN